MGANNSHGILGMVNTYTGPNKGVCVGGDALTSFDGIHLL